MRGHHLTALSHIEGGIKIISELQPSNKSKDAWSISDTPYVAPSVLNPIFIRLDRQASEVVYGRKRVLLYQMLDDKASGYHEDVPAIFTSLEQARNSLDHFRTFAMRFIESAASQPSFADADKRAHTLHVLKTLSSIRLQQWSAAFNAFISTIAPSDKVGQAAIHVLKMHRIVTGVVTTIDEERSFTDETVWDQYKPQFARIISHAASIVELQLESQKQEGNRFSSPSLDSGIGFPLYFVSSKCRDGALRWKAIELLNSVDRQEGLYNSHLVAKVARHLIEVEECGLDREGEFLTAAEVPRENRLGGTEFRLVSDRRVHLTHNRCGKREIGGDGYEGGIVVVEEWLEW
jgi:hypothetical protein